MNEFHESADVALTTKGLTKHFGGVTANKDVDIEIRVGEIRAIMGENGAGKSTFCNMITGVIPPSEGEIYFYGKKVELTHPKEALALGIRMVYQERNLIEFLTGAQSIFLGLEQRKYGLFSNEKEMKEQAKKICDKLGVDIPLDIPVYLLSPAQQQMIEIVRAVTHDPKLLILDEPSASLGSEETEILFKVCRDLKKKGVTIIIITHKLDEMFEIADTISILRNGEHIITVDSDKIDRMSAVSHMLGKEAVEQFPAVVNTTRDEELLRVNRLSEVSGRLSDINLYVNAGEVVGIFGLVGSGRTELLETIYTLRKRTGGEIRFKGKDILKKTKPSDMIGMGMFLIPEDRKQNSLFKDYLNLRENLSIARLELIKGKLGLTSVRKEKSLFKEATGSPELRLVYADDSNGIESLSGGNQQKVVLGRWIFKENLSMLLLDEPTEGIDVGVKYDIYILIREIAKSGKGILIVSSELPELTGICDRLYILKEGRLIAEKQRENFDNTTILEMVL